MSWYNAAMGKPIQFSMRRMFLFVTIFCVECALWNVLDRCFSEKYRSGQDYVLLFFIGIGFLIGVWGRNPVAGCLTGFGVLDLLKLNVAIFEGKLSKLFL
jgi:small-conductance mechanosensitive channel